MKKIWAREKKREVLETILLILILLGASWFRFTGVNWDENQHPHPDERFLTMVETAILPVTGCEDPGLAISDCPLAKRIWITPKQYFDTATSTLNPYNRGYGFYVYGTLPLFLVRYTAEVGQGLSPQVEIFAGWLNDISSGWNLEIPLGNRLAQKAQEMNYWTGYDGVNLVGRRLSALADLGTILLLFLIAKRVYGRRIALLAAIFSSLAVMQIQQSHFFTVDNFVNFFMFLTLYFAVEIGFGGCRGLDVKSEIEEDQEQANHTGSFQLIKSNIQRVLRDRLMWLSLAFGFSLGMAVASKINAVVLAIMLPAALLMYYARMDRDKRPGCESLFGKIAFLLIIGGLASLVAFRLFQPYAFEGPGFFGVKPVAGWIDSLRQQRAQAGGMSDVPWALQWARRNHLYSFENLTMWGLGLPLGLLAWAGFLTMGWRILKGEWRLHVLLWGWTGAYFLWQSLQFNPTMRYQLPVYPLLAMMAAWLVFHLWELRKQKPLAGSKLEKSVRWLLPYAGAVSGVLVLAATVAWAVAFTGIYVRMETRLAASRWIFQNLPGPINLPIEKPDGTIYNQPLPFPNWATVSVETPYQTSFIAQEDGSLDRIILAHVSNHLLEVTLIESTDGATVASGWMLVIPGESREDAQFLHFTQQATLYNQHLYSLRIKVVDPTVTLDLCDSIKLTMATNTGNIFEQVIEPASPCTASEEQPYQVQFTAQGDGTLVAIFLQRAADVEPPRAETLQFTLATTPESELGNVLAQATVTTEFTPREEARGDALMLVFDHPVPLVRGQTYFVRLATSGGKLTLTGAAPANETDFDLGLPFPVDSYNGYGGLYVGGLNLQVYYDDNDVKLHRLLTTLNQADTIFIPSNHQFAQIVRLPERFPLMTTYYRELLGCPDEKEIIWCYNVAEPGMFRGTLGFDLVATFTSYPSLGPLVVNDQFAEEAFTIYDHVKVFIFRKNADFDQEEVAAILEAVDLTHVVHLLPGQAAGYKTLLLPEDRLEAQQEEGTWSDLFDPDSLQNQQPVLGLLFWYLTIFGLGLVTYPILRAALPGLADRGYPLARVAGLLLWAWLAWMAGSTGLGYSRLTIGSALGLITLLGGWMTWRQRGELKIELQEKWKYFLFIEGVFLIFFLLDLGIRMGNPDLWHPYKGGERPMNFSYFNAILKSSSFPPYDPWFAGGYINYYYYGYVIVGTPVKLLGIVPSVAYNFILPTLFACLAVSAFSIGYNLLKVLPVSERPWKVRSQGAALLSGAFSLAAVVLLGNLGIVRMFTQGFQRLAAPDGVIEGANLFQHLFWTLKGFIMSVSGANLPYVRGDFYWIPSRVLPDASGSPITEFPLFTFLYSDLHAHMISLMLTVFVIGWVLSVLRSKAAWASSWHTGLGFFLGGLAIGALKPTNTWDIYTYLVLAVVVVFYTKMRYADVKRFPANLTGLPDWLKRVFLAFGAGAVLVGLSMLLYQPFSYWFSSGVYTSLEVWKGGRSNLSSYLVHWGVFLFFIVSWMVWETRMWMAETPASSLRKLRPYLELILVVLALLVLVLIAQQLWVMSSSQNIPWNGVTILWLALPLAVWVAVLMLKPGLADGKRLVLFLTGTSLLITMAVELVVVSGDIGRMNTVFKFYLQAWIMLGLSAAAATSWLLPEVRKWLPVWRNSWQVLAGLLVFCSGLFLVIGGLDKIRDRWFETAPHSLDSMAYMEYAEYADFGVNLELDEDYRAIRWMQENIQGSPVIVEANCVEYHWCSRMTIYTGLPGVVGWNWHQRQQRALMSDQVWSRVNEIGMFYGTTDPEMASDFLRKYNVKYIVVGQLERAAYPVEGMVKFEQYNGILWQEVYRDGQMFIYEVLR